MKKLFMILPLVLVLCFAYGCEKEDDDVAVVDIAAETEAVRAADIAWAKTAEAKDVDAMTSFLAEDCAILWSSDFRDRAWFHDYWTEQFSDPGRELTWQTEKVIVADSGDLAYSIGRLQNTRVVEEEKRTSKGVYVAVWKKQTDGNWKIAVLK